MNSRPVLAAVFAWAAISIAQTDPVHPAVLAFGCAKAVGVAPGLSFSGNPAGLMQEPGFKLSAAALNCFDMQGVWRSALGVEYAGPAAGVGAGLATLGLDTVYREIEPALSGAFRFRKLDAGAVVSLRLADAGFGLRGPLPSAGAGFRYRCPGRIVLSAVSGPYALLSGSGVPAPPEYRFGAAFDSERLYAALEVSVESGRSPVLTLAQEFRLLKPLVFRIGLNSRPFRFGFGFGVQFKGAYADAAALTHPELGLCRGAGVGYVRRPEDRTNPYYRPSNIFP